MTKAMEFHAQGMRLIDVALAVGYASEGAYAQAFKKRYGYPPSRLQMID
jgi:AraC-like DNA-binding protein